MLTALVIIAAVVIGILIAASLRPNTFRTERSTVIKAAPEKIYPLINDLHAFNTWNPFKKLDPESKDTYVGAGSGRGAAYTWEGKKLGAGRMEIVDTAAPRLVVMKLDFLKPFEAHNTAEFKIEPQGDGTRVTWAMFGPATFMSKLMGLVFNPDKMVGGSFERGLADLKAAAET
jgi:hypothetical protein